MVAGCGMKCIKFTIFFFNFIFLLIGTALIIAGAYVMVALRDLAQFAAFINVLPAFVIVIGSLIFIPAFFGCCGAIRESRCMLITYAVFMGILMLLEVVGAIVGFVYGMKIRDTVESKLSETMDQFDVDFASTALWSFVQKSLTCCGMHGPQDWVGKRVNISRALESCCILQDCNTTVTGTVQNLVDDFTIYGDGCLNDAESTLKRVIYIVSGVVIGIAMIELIGILFAACLSKAIKAND